MSLEMVGARSGGWRDVTVGDVVTLQRGFDITKAEQSDGPYPVVSSSGPTSTHSTYKVQAPGVIIGRKGSLGGVYFSDTPFWPHDTTLWVKDFHSNDPKFVYYWLQTLGLGRYDVGASNPTLNRNHVHLLPASIPGVETQRKIGTILSAYDELIENCNLRIRLLDEMTQRIYREWFVDFRHPGHEAVPLMESELGLIPNGWHVGTLGDLVDVNANTIRKIQDEEEIRYIDIASVTRGIVEEPKRMVMGKAPSRARRRVADGDIIWSTVRPNLRAYALLLSPGSNCVASTGFAVLSPRRASFAYVYAMTTTDEFVEYLVARATGSAYPAVLPSVLLAAPTVVPASEVLGAYADVGEPLMRLASNLGLQIATLRATRDLLLPRLISGEIDISDLDITLREAAA